MYEPQRFEIEKRAQKPDGIGGMAEVWESVCTVNGYLDLASGTDLAGVQNVATEESTHILIVPEIPGAEITDKMRVTDATGRLYDVTYVDDPVGAGHHLEIYLTYRRTEQKA